MYTSWHAVLASEISSAVAGENLTAVATKIYNCASRLPHAAFPEGRIGAENWGKGAVGYFITVFFSKRRAYFPQFQVGMS